jgi:hypothetical protein
MGSDQDRQLRLLINKANGNFVTFRFRRHIEAVLADTEIPLSLCMVSKVWIDESLVRSASSPWVLRTDQQLVIVQVGQLTDLLRATIAKPRGTCFAIDDVSAVTDLDGQDFEIQLANGTTLTVRSRPWPDRKFTKAFRDGLAAVSGSESQKKSPASYSPGRWDGCVGDPGR